MRSGAPGSNLATPPASQHQQQIVASSSSSSGGGGSVFSPSGPGPAGASGVGISNSQSRPSVGALSNSSSGSSHKQQLKQQAKEEKERAKEEKERAKEEKERVKEKEKEKEKERLKEKEIEKAKEKEKEKDAQGAAASTSTAATDDEAKGKDYALQQIIVRFLDINLNLKYFEMVSIWCFNGHLIDSFSAAELAAKKSRLKQKLVKSARSVAIFSLKLKERRQREAEKAATIAVEHAKVGLKR